MFNHNAIQKGVKSTKFDHFGYHLHFALSDMLKPSKLIERYVECMKKEFCLKNGSEFVYKIKNGNFDFKDAMRSKWPSEIDEELLYQLIAELKEKMECVYYIIENHLH